MIILPITNICQGLRKCICELIKLNKRPNRCKMFRTIPFKVLSDQVRIYIHVFVLEIDYLHMWFRFKK